MIRSSVFMHRSVVAVTVLGILGWAAVAQAGDTLEALPATRPLADTPIRLVLPREHLLGDWLGARTWLENHGVTPAVTFVTDALGNPTGGMQQGFRGASNLGLDLVFWRLRPPCPSCGPRYAKREARASNRCE